MTLVISDKILLTKLLKVLVFKKVLIFLTVIHSVLNIQMFPAGSGCGALHVYIDW